MPEQENNHNQPQDSKLPPAPTGNASNPSANDPEMEPASNNQLLDEKAEKYLREVASIEDLPDEQDQQDMDETMEHTKGDS